jgi:hypothetical protein
MDSQLRYLAHQYDSCLWGFFGKRASTKTLPVTATIDPTISDNLKPLMKATLAA